MWMSVYYVTPLEADVKELLNICVETQIYIYFDIGATSNSNMMKSQSAQLRRFKECHEQTTLIQIQLATMRPERKYESE